MTVDAGGTAIIERRAPSAGTSSPNSELPDEAAEKLGVNYACLRCGSITSGTEISRLPEIKCICGFKVFIKARPSIVKSIKAI